MNTSLENYKVEKKLKQDGYGSTYTAKITESNKNCIIKNTSCNKLNLSTTGLEQEFRIMRNLNHPNIPKLLDFFTTEKENSLDVYLVQEYIKGENLKEIIKKGKLFNEAEVIEIALKICKILIYIHSFSLGCRNFYK